MTDDRAEMKAARDAGLVKRHEQRLARAQEMLDAKAEAWEEGWRQGVRDANRPEVSGTDNPYRKEIAP